MPDAPDRIDRARYRGWSVPDDAVDVEEKGEESRCVRRHGGIVRAPAGCHGRPGTEINLRTNRSCRLVPAHQGMKTRRSDSVQRIDTVGSPTPRPDPCGGQAPALHSPLPHLIVGPLVVY